MSDDVTAEAATTTVEFEREFAAPPGAVYRAFVDPGLLTDWYGPRDVHVLRESVTIDPVVDGWAHLTVVRADEPGRESRVAIRFLDLEEPHRIVAVQQIDGHESRFDVHLSAAPAGCRMRVRQHECPAPLAESVAAGWAESCDKLDHGLRMREA